MCVCVTQRVTLNILQSLFIEKGLKYKYDYMPKGVQEKRTEVLENKVDRMRVNNAFSE